MLLPSIVTSNGATNNYISKSKDDESNRVSNPDRYRHPTFDADEFVLPNTQNQNLNRSQNDQQHLAEDASHINIDHQIQKESGMDNIKSPAYSMNSSDFHDSRNYSQHLPKASNSNYSNKESHIAPASRPNNSSLFQHSFEGQMAEIAKEEREYLESRGQTGERETIGQMNCQEYVQVEVPE